MCLNVGMHQENTDDARVHLADFFFLYKLFIVSDTEPSDAQLHEAANVSFRDARL